MMNKLIAELRRRNVFRVAGVYAVVGWILMQVVSVMTPALNLPDWVDSFFAIALLIGFPIAILLAWAFEMTPEGVKRTENVKDGKSIAPQTGRKLDFAILGGLVIVGVLIIGSRFLPQKSAAPEVIVQAQTDERPSLAVLPFEDFSSGKDQEYFANGISEELLNVLARIDGLRVSSRTSSFSFKERDASTKEIAEALNVEHILEGSIRKSGATLRITAQLIDTATDEHMWSQTYDKPLTTENLFAIQDEIAAAIVAELKGKLSLSPTKQAPRTNSLEAYELYLRARQQMNKRKPESLRAAEDGYKQVISLDPEFSLGYSGLAETYLLMPVYTEMTEEEGPRLAKPLVARALELAPNSAESLTSATLLATAERNTEEALGFANRAIAANPNYSDAYLRQARALKNLGRLDEALSAIQKARTLDPLSGVILANLAELQLVNNDIEGAKQTMRDNMRWNPDNPFGLYGLATLLYKEGDLAGAHSLFKDVEALNPEASFANNALFGIYNLVGLYDLAFEITNDPNGQIMAMVSMGDNGPALKFIRENPEHPRVGYFLYVLGDQEAAYLATRKFMEQFSPILSKDTDIIFTHLAYIYQKANDPEAASIIAKLEAYLGPTKSAADFNTYSELYTGAALQMLKNNPDETYVWIDRFLDLGFSDLQMLKMPVFEALYGTSEFAAREKRMAENAAKHRAAIESQLANPKPNWGKN